MEEPARAEDRAPTAVRADRGRVRPVRVLHLTDYLDVFNGVERLLRLLAVYGDRSRHELVVATTIARDELRDHFTERGVPVHVVAKRDGLDWRFLRGLAALFREVRPDIVTAYNLSPWLYAVPAAHLARVPGGVIGAIHGQPDPGYRTRLLERALALGSRGVIAVSEYTARSLRDACGIPAAKVRVLYNGIETARFAPRPKDERVLRELSIPPDAPVIGTVGRIAPEKDLESLVAAYAKVAARFRAARLVHVGDSDVAFRHFGPRELRALAERHGVGAGVSCLGARRDIPEIVSCFDVFAMSSLREGFPLVLLEAMALGKPVVSTAVGGIPELVDDGVTGALVPPRDPDALGAALAALVADPARRAAMGERATERVLQHFRIEQFARDLEALYEGVVRDPRVGLPALPPRGGRSQAAAAG